MFEEFFDKCELQDPEIISASQSEKIKSALQKRVADNSPQKHSNKEENIMKTKTVRTFIIAAIAAVVGTIGIVGAASTLITREQVIKDLASKNSLNDLYYQEAEKNAEIYGEDRQFTPRHELYNVGEYFITDENLSKYNYFDGKYGILLVHEGKIYDGDFGIAYGIEPDGNGGYKFDNSNPVEDEQLLAAIEKGLAKYGDHFFIWY